MSAKIVFYVQMRNQIKQLFLFCSLTIINSIKLYYQQTIIRITGNILISVYVIFT